MTKDFSLKDTLNLPKTAFPMQAQLVKREPERLQHWEEMHLYEAIQKKNAQQPRFLLHDGPPFTNGDVHIGTALNKILKDIILRYKSMCGFSTPYLPGWDCHGLPIEHKVAKEQPELLTNPVAMRKACAQFSDHFIQHQEGQFRRLGILADWEHAYQTKNPSYEAHVLRTFAKLVRANWVYRSKKPVYWSILCKTALAEAEIEYKEVTSTSIWVKFRVLHPETYGLGINTFVVIWTTTPWTMPANRAIAVSPHLSYVALKAGSETYLVAEALAEKFIQECSLTHVARGKRFIGKELEGMKTQHPFLHRESPVVCADYVTTDAGTGCVHTAPGHGMDDYLTGLKYHLEIACPVDDQGCLTAEDGMPPELVGKPVWTHRGNSPANEAVIAFLKSKGALLQVAPYVHSYPHCWRSKSPVIARALPQWFIDLKILKEKAKAAIEQVQWLPDWGKSRILGSVEARPDWCISRQRTWGIPLPAFFDEQGEGLLDADVMEALANKIERYGTQWWFENDEKTLLKGISLPSHWQGTLRKSTDTLDVWIDSGCSHVAVLAEKGWAPADLYLEGSDQHRGWFQSSLLTALAIGDQAPYRTVLTHGFLMDEDRRKISKSSADPSKPQTSDAYVAKYGADILRLWIASEDYRKDIPVSETILQHVIATYRTLRNTLRFQLGNLYDFHPSQDGVPYEKMMALDRWVLCETNAFLAEVTLAYESYDFHKVYQAINRFCTLTLSARYHDILKDRLYTLRADGWERRSAQTALFEICRTLLKVIAPILTFTADEAWGYLWGNSDFGYEHSIHLEDFPQVNPQWEQPQLAKEFSELFHVREAVQVELEKARQQKVIGQSLDAQVTIVIGSQHPQSALIQKYQEHLPEYWIVSAVHVKETQGEACEITVQHADGVRCPRTWRWVDRLVEVEGFGAVSERCAAVLQSWKPRL